jgi:hypothetical protein
MEGIGEVQYLAFKFLALVWGLLAILISAAYFFCEWKPKKCDDFTLWLQRRFPALGGKKKD